jgi:DNA-binding NarL/FixJ family response regulator
MSNPIRVMVVDDHPLIRTGVGVLLSDEPDMALIAQAGNGDTALREFRAHRPDVTLIDLCLPQMSGLDLLGAIRHEFPHARIIVVTSHGGDAQVLRALKAGARGYLLKGALYEELPEAIRTVHAGKRSLSREAVFEIAEHVSDDPLTAAEVRILQLIADGNANKEIAAQLNLSEPTVKGQVRSILSKLGVKDRTNSAEVDVKRGIIDL